MCLVSNPTSVVASPTCKSCGRSELGRRRGVCGRCQAGRAQSYFRLKANIHGDLEFRHRNCLDFQPPMPNAVSRKRICRIFGSPSTRSRLVTFTHESFSFVKGVLFCLIMGSEGMAHSGGKSLRLESERPGSESWLCPHPQRRGAAPAASVNRELPCNIYL